MRKGGWIQTYDGRKFFPLDASPHEVAIIDIAHSLSMQCRFNGHTSEFYSVAEHCCHVSDLLPGPLQLAGLLHDASEAYLCDLPRPLKRSQGFADAYLQAESELEQVIARRYNFPYPYPEEIHKADEVLLNTEARQLMSPLHPDWPIGDGVAGLFLPCWSPADAKAEFLRRFELLGGKC